MPLIRLGTRLLLYRERTIQQRIFDVRFGYQEGIFCRSTQGSASRVKAGLGDGAAKKARLVSLQYRKVTLCHPLHRPI